MYVKTKEKTGKAKIVRKRTYLHIQLWKKSLKKKKQIQAKPRERLNAQKKEKMGIMDWHAISWKLYWIVPTENIRIFTVHRHRCIGYNVHFLILFFVLFCFQFFSRKSVNSFVNVVLFLGCVCVCVWSVIGQYIVHMFESGAIVPRSSVRLGCVLSHASKRAPAQFNRQQWKETRKQKNKVESVF